MNIKDIVELAKAGYKPNEVKELMEMAARQNPNEPEPNPNEPEPNLNEPEPNPNEPEPNPNEPEPNPNEPEPNHDESNEISKLNEKIAELEKELKVAQEHNRRSGGNQHDELAPEDYLKDVMRNFY